VSAAASAATPHVPVLLETVTELLERPDGVVVDVTLGAGGHAAAIAARRLQLWGRADLLGIDRDESALALARERLQRELDDPRVRVRLVDVVRRASTPRETRVRGISRRRPRSRRRAATRVGVGVGIARWW